MTLNPRWMPASGHAKSVARRRMPGRPPPLLNKRSACCEKLQRSASAIASYVSTILAERVRRWFLQNHGITFQAFQRMQRLNMALQELKAGRSTTDVAFDSGYESLSGFGYTCKN